MNLANSFIIVQKASAPVYLLLELLETARATAMTVHGNFESFTHGSAD